MGSKHLLKANQIQMYTMYCESCQLTCRQRPCSFHLFTSFHSPLGTRHFTFLWWWKMCCGYVCVWYIECYQIIISLKLIHSRLLDHKIGLKINKTLFHVYRCIPLGWLVEYGLKLNRGIIVLVKVEQYFKVVIITTILKFE